MKNKMNSVTLLGFFAAFCTTFAGVPQIYRIIKIKEARDISLATYLMISIGLACWLIYGIILGDFPLIFANSLSLAFSLTIIFLKYKYR